MVAMEAALLMRGSVGEVAMWLQVCMEASCLRWTVLICVILSIPLSASWWYMPRLLGL